MKIGIFGAGGFARQIVDFLPPGTVLFTDTGGGDLRGFPVLPFEEARDCELLIAVSDPILRCAIALRWHNGFGTLVAPTAEVSAFAKIGEGAILCRQSIVEAGAEIGAHFHANVRSTVGHESRIGDFVTLGPHAGICGGCVIERGAQIGAGAIIKQGIKVGAGALVGMGAIVGKDVPAGAKAIGNPARIFTSPNRLAGNLGR